MRRQRVSLVCLFVVLFVAAVGILPATELEAADAPPLLLILDASGSMWGQVDGENKIVIARRVVGGLVDGLQDDSEVGVVAYGHRREGDCTDIETVVGMGPLDKAAVKSTVDGLNPKGKTPITKALQTAFDSLASRDGGGTMILVSDGLETCGGDPCAAVRAAKDLGVDFRLHVVGFDVAGEDVSQLECAAQAGGGLFSSAENADELAAALDEAVAMAAAVPAGRLSVKAIADGELQDVAVLVSDATSGEEAGGGRTYTAPDTNPRIIPLEDGAYDVQVQVVGVKGDIRREFRVEIVDGGIVERELDFSTGELSIGVTRNGELSDAVFRVLAPGTDEEVAAGRTYTGARSNPSRIRLISGTYEVEVGSVEISGAPRESLGEVTIEPQGAVAVSHEWQTGTLKIGAARAGELVDATLGIVDLGSGKSVAQGRTYKSESSNPKSFTLLPGDYRITINEIRGERRTVELTVRAGETTERMVDPAGGE